MGHGHPPPIAVRIIAVMFLAGGLSCVMAAAFPPSPETPVALLYTVGASCVLLSGAIMVAGDRLPRWALHVLAAVSTLTISLIVWHSATAVGEIVAAFCYFWLCVYMGFFFTLPETRAHMALIGVAFGAALLAADPWVPANAWVFMMVSLIVVSETLGRQSARLRHEAHTDSLTGALNRKGLAIASQRAFALADRTGMPLTLALIDLDGFKQINDRDGHSAGDGLLVDVARSWRKELELSDIFARIGGDEFALVLVGFTPAESSRLLERLREVSPISWSAGVIARRQHEDLTTCLARADANLYEEKGARELMQKPNRLLLA
ncbi:MAG TPA: GGDEF domain-containing protein [Brevundimonas sp.]|nr:GGDEF domain-containing protein [Brevundimonas sp.]